MCVCSKIGQEMIDCNYMAAAAVEHFRALQCKTRKK